MEAALEAYICGVLTLLTNTGDGSSSGVLYRPMWSPKFPTGDGSGSGVLYLVPGQLGSAHKWASIALGPRNIKYQMHSTSHQWAQSGKPFVHKFSGP